MSWLLGINGILKTVGSLAVTILGALIVVRLKEWRERRKDLKGGRTLTHRLSQHASHLEQVQYVMQFRELLQQAQKAFYKKRQLPDGLSFLAEDGIESSLIAVDRWIPGKPLPMENLHLAWEKYPAHVHPLDQNLPNKLRDDLKYSIENNPTYRLLNVSREGDDFQFTFGPGTYDEFIASCEALTWETATEVLTFSKKKFGDKFEPSAFDASQLAKFAKKAKAEKRGQIDILDLTNRSASVGINVLTVMKHRNSCQFLVHDRSKHNVVEAINTYHVVPAGTFQQVVLGDLDHTIEFDLCHTVFREFAEEILDGGEPTRKTAYSSMEKFYADFPVHDVANKMFHDPDIGKSIHYLGMGFDLLNLKPECMLLLVIDMDRVQERYNLPLKCNKEGYLNMHEFTIQGLQEFARDGRSLAVAQAIFLLACRHKKFIDELYAAL